MTPKYMTEAQIEELFGEKPHPHAVPVLSPQYEGVPLGHPRPVISLGF